jgi:hypothetical protein
MVQMREFKSIMNELLCPWFPVAGNHDVYWRPLDDPAKPFSQHDKDYEMHFGPLWYSFQHKQCNFIVLYSDEGNPETGEKNFSKPDSQRISDEQFAFLQTALERGKSKDHQFIFLHHPRWLGRGYGEDWQQRVHPLLQDTGNVTAVFAGHIHQMRYDPADGIEYVTLATVGGGQSGKLPEAGYLHQYHLVTVRPEQVAMAAFPVGEAINVREITADLQQQMSTLASQPVEFDRPIRLAEEGSPATTVTAVVSNPADRKVDFTLTPSSADSRWQISPNHVHGRLEPGERRELPFQLTYSSRRIDDAFRGLEFVLAQDYLTETTRYSVPESRTPAPFELDFDWGTPTGPNRALAVDGQNDSVAIDSSRLALPAGPFTVECWFNAERFGDRVGVLAKTEGSEFSLFASNGRLSGSVHLDGKYRQVASPEPTPAGSWTHVALVRDAMEIRLYVNGKLADASEVDPAWQRTLNTFPLLIAADPSGNGAPMSFFDGLIDEVRVSRGARYRDAFTPERRLRADDATLVLYNFDQTLGPFHRDAGARRLHVTAQGGAHLTDAQP